MVKINKKIPAFSGNATGGIEIQSKNLQGKTVVIYFYPKDNTPGCTQQGQDFRDNYTSFQHQQTIILGVSRDNLSSHEKFKEKQNFPFELISDQDEKLCMLFDVMKEKSMYGKTYTGIERSTFLIDEKSVLRKEWRKVKVKGHVDEVLTAIKAL
jgi:thioredoxin-dependent peroxiredoxin